MFYLITTVIQFSAGVLTNGFIVGLNCIDWAKSRTVTPFDMILTSLAFSRICLQLLLTLLNFLYKLQQNFLESLQIQQSLQAVWIFTNQVNVCFASCLALYYCGKIATFKQSVFKWLKLRLSILVPWMLLGSLMYSMVITVCFILLKNSYTYWISSDNSTDSLSNNRTMPQYKKDSLEFTLLMHSIGSIFPLSIFIASSVLLTLSLWRHIGKMNLNSDLNPSFRNPSTDAHVRALKSVMSFFILYIIYCVASTLSLGKVPYFRDERKIMVSIFMCSAYPFLHSIILVLGNPKLKLALSRILHPINSCFRNGTS
ncbi:taste receptor type 2 member 7-like [Carettochelys insculpta]|uniref:taste receptor type 2 member 7-like n=1 Tax=Carettochelys insculpta TaxID=44489 RepID=UPI003EBA3957